ncbi:MAG: hypothetical protein ACJAYG_000136 [Oceanicoccus sp.]|jgi:hypothetical protein
MKTEFSDFSDFYAFYLSEHSQAACRYCHYLGLSLVLLGIALIIGSDLTLTWLLILPIIGYSCAWAGHFVFEKNRPASFDHPFYSFISDWVMYRDWLLTPLRRK